jgi:ribosomal protein S12 methylthiotransferase accessory factor YcaO
MLSLASLRYRNVLSRNGGPVAGVEFGIVPVRGRQVTLANAWLTPGLTPKRHLALFSDANGTGTHRVPAIARHKAISEALERWAFHDTVRSERAAEFGFDVDPSTNGMAAFPGLLRRQARRAAVLEAVERFSLISWWDGKVQGRVFDTDWPGVSAIAIDGPFGGVTVVVWARTEWGGYVYGHAAEESFGAACERAVVELARHELVMRGWWLAFVGGEKRVATNIFERRGLYFASDEGHEDFLRHVRCRATGAAPVPDVICDSDLPGPWDEYATVWRFALRPPSDGYLRGGDRYFFL